jgi:energy-coupling factor transport system ATP-binding protein
MQRVALASALVARPALLLLDEVTAQLDPVGRREVQAVLRRIGHETTVLMADLNAPPLDVDRLVVMEAGSAVAQGRPTQITNEQLSSAGFRVPQLRRLAEAVGRPEVAAGGAQAVEALRDLAMDAAWPSPPESAPRPVLLEARRLTFRYTPERSILSGLDVSFACGEFTAILGSNGSGKTTLSLLLAGVLSPAAGDVVVHAETPEGRRVGYVFQEPTFQMLAGTVEDEIAFGPRQLGWPEEVVQAVVDRERARFDLPLGVNPVNLPPAQARQLAIASVLAISPSVLILDEPTNGLDEIETRALMEILAKLHRGGQTILLITHDVEIACEYAERVLVMSEGEIRLDGTPAEVMRQTEILRECDVMPPPVVDLSRALWPDALPALSVAEFVGRLRQPGAVAPPEVAHTLNSGCSD